MTATVPTIFFPRRNGEPPDPVPYVLTEGDLVRLARLDETGAEHPDRTLARYRDKGLLKGTQIGREIRYQLPDALEFLRNLRDSNPR